MSELKPCPKCGGKPALRQEYAINVVFEYMACTECGFRTTSLASDPEEEWNRRANDGD